MENRYHPVIVVVAYNRPHSLKRLLFSLKAARNITQAKLIISIDNQEPHNLDVKEIADSFEWPYGEKEVIYQEKRLGLRKHILQCGDLSEQYGSVIILEDDLYVSPYFYDYTIHALNFYATCDQIVGISLYNQPREEISEKPFCPIVDSSDVYFVQFPSSWGQAWTCQQWRKFKEWYETKPNILNVGLPDKILKWPETSWKKYFCAYVLLKDLFFVYPRLSLTTNFNDPGTHLKKEVNNEGQTQIRLFEKEYRFMPFDESCCKYDIYSELKSSCINQLTNQFLEYSYELDLYGNKNIAHVKSAYVITSKPVKAAIIGFKRAFKPHELNIILSLQGEDLSMSRKEDVIPFISHNDKTISDFRYFYNRNLLGWKVLLRDSYIRIFKRKYKL